MRRRRLLLRSFVLAHFGLFSAFLSAQSVFVLPSLSGSTNATVFTADPFNQVAVISAAAINGTYAFAGPSGKFYLVSNTSTDTIQETDSSFANIRTITNLSGAVYATITPDGKHLLVEAGGGLLTIIDTSTDSIVNTGLFLGGTVLDLAVSIDSTRAYALVNSSAGLQLSVVKLSVGTLPNMYTIPGLAGSGLAVGPSGLIYVSTSNAILELDPNTLAVRYTIAVTGRPGRLYFTPDGKTGIAANQTASNGTEIFVIDLGSRTLTASIPQTAFLAGVTIDQLFPVSGNRVLAYSSGSQSLFDVTLNPQSATPFSFSSAGAVSAVAVSNSVPATNSPNTQFVFFTSGSTIYRVDLNANQITGQQTLSGSAGAIAFAATGATNGTAAALLTFGDNQSVAPKAQTAPLVVKVVDAQGRPLAGQPVTFSTNSTGVTFSNGTSLTDNAGNASTTITGAITGAVSVNATSGSLTATFTVNIGGGGGGGPTGAGGLTVISGQGQVLPASAIGVPLVLQLTDQNGVPQQGQSVVFTLQNGKGSIGDGAGQSASTGGTVNVTTSSCTATSPAPCTPGLAQINFSSSGLAFFPGFETDMITATASTGSTQTLYETATAGSGFDPTTLTLTNAPSSLAPIQAGQTMTGAITAIVSYGSNNLQYVGLHIINADDPTMPAPAYCAGPYAPYALSDAKGIISCDLTVPSTEAPGIYHFFVDLGNRSKHGSYTLVVVAASPANASVVSGDKQSGAPGQHLNQPLVVLVTDAGSKPLAGVSVTWSATPSTGATFNPATSTTDSSGHASTTVTLGNTPGSVQVQAKAGSLSAQTFNLTINVPIAGVQLVSGGGQSAALNTAFGAPVVVKVVNASGQGVPGVSVTFTTTNGATVGSNTAISDPNGNASTTVTAGNSAGTITVTAQSGSFATSATLTALPPGPSNIVFLNGASFAAGISPGAIVAIQGTGLAPGIQGVITPSNTSGQLPTTLQGVTVTFNGTPAPIFSVSNVNGVQQIAVQAPYELIGSSTATVTITVSGGASATISNVPIQPYAPGLFETTAFGAKQAIATHADGSYVSPSNPAHAGENITLYLTGLGQTNPTTGTNQIGVAGQTVVASVVGGLNGAGVPAISAQTLPGVIGVYTLTITVPAGTAPGNIGVSAVLYDSANNGYNAQGSVLPVQ